MILALLAAAWVSAAPPSEEALRAEVAPIVDLFYGHDFDKAGPAALALESRHPGHPSGPLFQAIVKYQRWVAEGLKDDGSWDAVDGDLNRATAFAKAMEKDSPAQAHYYKGAALGFRARGLAAQKRFMRALPSASSSLHELRQALALDPTLEDARLGLGMYHYFAARMPTAAKPLARLLMGEPGDRDLGLKELWTVARSTGVARMEARAVLSMILSKNDEADWHGAEALLAELMARYPRNPIYRLRRTFVAERLEDFERAVALADPDGTWIDALHPGLRDNARASSRYRAAESLLFLNRLDAAEKHLKALDDAKAPKGLGPWIRLRRGNLDDARGRRDAALAAYRTVTEKVPSLLAARYTRTPFPAGPREVAPFFAGY